MLPFSFHAIDKSQGEEVTEPTLPHFCLLKQVFHAICESCMGLESCKLDDRLTNWSNFK